jgi:hypothetical protein
MIPLLATIITIYCVLRLTDMAAEGRRREKEGKGGGFWVFYIIGAFIIVLLCLGIHNKSDEFVKVTQAGAR